MSDRHCLVMKGCIIWRTKHVSSYEARATKLMYHILRGKWDEPMAGASPILNVLRGSLASCYTDQAPRAVSAFQSVFAVIWLFPTRLPACPTILEAFGRSLQLWYETLKVFAAVSVVCNIRHIYLSTRHLVRDSASDCKYRMAGGVPCFVSLIAHECISIFCPLKGHCIADCSQYVQ